MAYELAYILTKVDSLGLRSKGSFMTVDEEVWKEQSIDITRHFVLVDSWVPKKPKWWEFW